MSSLSKVIYGKCKKRRYINQWTENKAKAESRGGTKRGEGKEEETSTLIVSVAPLGTCTDLARISFGAPNMFITIPENAVKAKPGEKMRGPVREGGDECDKMDRAENLAEGRRRYNHKREGVH